MKLNYYSSVYAAAPAKSKTTKERPSTTSSNGCLADSINQNKKIFFVIDIWQSERYRIIRDNFYLSQLQRRRGQLHVCIKCSSILG